MDIRVSPGARPISSAMLDLSTFTINAGIILPLQEAINLLNNYLLKSRYLQG
jgi:hypothetical protein